MRLTATLLSTAAAVLAMPALAQDQTSPVTTNAAVAGQSDTASARLALLPPFVAREESAGPAPVVGASTPASVYAIGSEVLLAAYEPCAASPAEPRIRYLRRDCLEFQKSDLLYYDHSKIIQEILRVYHLLNQKPQLVHLTGLKLSLHLNLFHQRFYSIYLFY